MQDATSGYSLQDAGLRLIFYLALLAVAVWVSAFGQALLTRW